MKFEVSGYVKRPENVVLLEDLRAVAVLRGREWVTYKEYMLAGRFYPSIFLRRFGSWNNALVAAGLRPGKFFNISAEQLLDNLGRLWMALGRQPYLSDLFPPLSKYSRRPYLRVFGSWSHTLIRMAQLLNGGGSLTPALSKGEGGVVLGGASESLEWRNRAESESKGMAQVLNGSIAQCGGDGKKGVGCEAASYVAVTERRNDKSIGWRVRHLVMKRDLFRCCACGASPAMNPGTELHVDHIVPVSKGGSCAVDNLQTLCSVCNIGKGNL